MKICPNCGKLNPNSYVQCECGEDIENVVTVTNEEIETSGGV